MGKSLKTSETKIRRNVNLMKFGKPKVKLPNYNSPISSDEVCAICGINQPLDRAHIFPKRLLLDIQNIPKELLDYEGLNILILCRNHHTLFDRNKLDKSDMAKIFQKVCSIYEMMIDKVIFNIVGEKGFSKRHQDEMFGHIRKVMISYQ